MMFFLLKVFGGFNTQPPEGGWNRGRGLYLIIRIVSTHSRPKAAGLLDVFAVLSLPVSTHSRPKAAGSVDGGVLKIKLTFQHTAARRRLDKHICIVHICIHVSTHSRPKAAGLVGLLGLAGIPVSTHSRPKAAGAQS